ncbi:MAG: hypothetical protein ACT4RN_14190 [Pseudonocardia sp.]
MQTPWAPDLGSLRMLGGGRTGALLGPDAAVLWWCGPDFDDAPLCWQLLDPDGGVARFPELTSVSCDPEPAAASSATLLRDAAGTVEVCDGLLGGDGDGDGDESVGGSGSSGGGVTLVRLVGRRPGAGQGEGGGVPRCGTSCGSAGSTRRA